MKINKVITLMGDRIYLSFFVDEDHTFSKPPIMWFEDISNKTIDIGDNYDYFRSLDTNKKDIKESLRSIYPKEKGLFKEIKGLINLMKTYETSSYVGW